MSALIGRAQTASASYSSMMISIEYKAITTSRIEPSPTSAPRSGKDDAEPLRPEYAWTGRIKASGATGAVRASRSQDIWWRDST